jgi:hypothetical protein
MYREPRVRSSGTVAYRFNSFYLEPICVRIVAGTSIDLPESRQWNPVRDSVLPVEPTCPAGWAQIYTGGAFQREVRLPPDAPVPYRIEWFALSATGKRPEVIDIPDVRSIAVRPAW